MEYKGNGGQTGIPVGVVEVPYDTWVQVPRPDPLLPEWKINPKYKEKGFFVAGGIVTQHFLPGVTAEMLDWFWVNMEKGYYLWGPGSHKLFQWIREPWKYGYVQSCHYISENLYEKGPFFLQTGEPDDCMQRLDMDVYPFE